MVCGYGVVCAGVFGEDAAERVCVVGTRLIVGGGEGSRVGEDGLGLGLVAICGV